MSVFSILTLGCRVNQADSEQIRAILLQAGFQEVPHGQPCDLAIINTCTVTAEADRKSRQMVRRQARLAGNVLATGCGLAKWGGLFDSLAPEVHCLPPKERSNILEFLRQHGLYKAETIEVGQAKSTPSDLPQLRTRALLKVQEGCTHMCSFCIVPYVRGRSHSMTTAEAVAKVKALEKAGYQEVVLTGVHLAIWGSDLSIQQNLADLLEELIKASTSLRFRISSIEPMQFPEEIFALMAKYPQRICPHLHLVIQHASDKILKSMRRDYSLAHYDALVEKFVKTVPGAVLTTDVLVGFPGETEEDMQILLNYLPTRPFYHLHVFPYSKRQGTPAASLPEQIAESLKKSRARRVIALGEQIRRQTISAFIGTKRPVLVERLSKKSGFVVGTADNYISVELPGDSSLIGKIVEAEITPLDEEEK